MTMTGGGAVATRNRAFNTERSLGGHKVHIALAFIDNNMEEART